MGHLNVKTDLKEAGILMRDFSLFSDQVEKLGADLTSFIKDPSINAWTAGPPTSVVPYRIVNQLVSLVATKLDRPSFGLDLTTDVNSLSVFGPLEIVMRNSPTVGKAWEYWTEYVRNYCPMFQSKIQLSNEGDCILISYDVVTEGKACKVQGVEWSISLMYQMIIALSKGELYPQEVWFSHSPLSSADIYHRHFGNKIYFNKPVNAILINRALFSYPVLDRDDRLYDLANYFIEREYQPCTDSLNVRVRRVITEFLSSGDCTASIVATRLGYPTRYLQKLLHEEGESFDEIKDCVRRELAMDYLKEPRTFTQIAAMLGYSESSVLTRSCQRWFATSPRNMRAKLRECSRSAESR